MKTATCMNCGKVYTSEEVIARREQMEDFYICSACESRNKRDRYIKPDVVLFGDAGEWFTLEGFQTITKMIDQADCLLVLGSSLKVTPFSNFPNYRRKEVPMILINKGDSPYDHKQGVYVVHESIGKTLNQINEYLD